MGYVSLGRNSSEGYGAGHNPKLPVSVLIKIKEHKSHQITLEADKSEPNYCDPNRAFKAGEVIKECFYRFRTPQYISVAEWGFELKAPES